MKIFFIQFVVVYGYVGNFVVVFLLQCIGVEVFLVYMVNFFNYIGYGVWCGLLIVLDDVCEVIIGIEECGVFGQIDVIFSGYQGGEGIGDVIIDVVVCVKVVNLDVVYVCDFVMGNVKFGCFVVLVILVLLWECVVFVVDIIILNQFEFGFFIDIELDMFEFIFVLVDFVYVMGLCIVFVISVECFDCEEGMIEMFVVDEQGVWFVQILYLLMKVNGFGDVMVVLFMVYYVEIGSVKVVFECMVFSVYDLFKVMFEFGECELQFVEVQEFYVYLWMQFMVCQVC